MEYMTAGGTVYARMDRGDEIIGRILEVCEKEGIRSAIFSGIGGCGAAGIMTFDPKAGAFETRNVEGMLELVSLNGSVTVDDDGKYCHHTHGMFAFVEDGEHRVAGGHIASATVLYTAEIEIRPVHGGTIGRKTDPETGTGFWRFDG